MRKTKHNKVRSIPADLLAPKVPLVQELSKITTVTPPNQQETVSNQASVTPSASQTPGSLKTPDTK